MPQSFFVAKALLAEGWAENVLIEVSDNGIIETIAPNSIPNNAKTKSSDSLLGILIPGMPNLHSHAFQRAFAGFSETRGQVNDSFWTWRKTMYQFIETLDPEQAFIIARQLYIEMLKAGYTSVAEFHYLHHDNKGEQYSDPALMSHSVINGALAAGINLTHLPVYYRYSSFNEQAASTGQQRFTHQPDDYFRLVDSLFKSYGSEHQVNIGIAPHSLRAVSGADINAAIEVLDCFDAQAPIHIHIAEQMAEVNDCLSHTGQRPVQHLFDQCDVNKRWCLVHATHMNEQEAWELAASGAVAGLCLTTEANLGDGFFPAKNYLEQQGYFGIGSDSHISVSAMEELRLLEYGQRLLHQNRAVLCDEETPSVGRYLYQGALEGGARALNRNTGKIAEGQQADWLILDENNPSLFSKKDDQILDAMIFASNINPIKDVMVSGKWVIRDSHHELESESLLAFRKVLSDIVG